jgi:hypothetical protein
LPKRKVTKEKGTPLYRPFGLPSDFRKNRAAAELALCAQTVLADFPRFLRKSEAVQRGLKEGAVTRRARGSVFGLSGLCPDRVLKLLLKFPFSTAE